MPRGPYEFALDHQLWRRAVAEVPLFALDPLVSVPFVIADADRVATAGSCFAQHIAQRLQQDGSIFYVAEPAPLSLSAEEARRRNYGIYSCRYGNIYTVRQLLQLALRAFKRFEPLREEWLRPDERFVDLFRPTVEPDGFDTIDALQRDRASHLDAVRHMQETLDVFVFTLGQTECWRRRSDGAILPVAPGIAGGEWDDRLYEFLNLRTTSIVDDFLAFVDLVRGSNPRARFILTISPVPLAATYERRHALVSNTVSKATLCVAAADICAARERIVYFPSYELVTAPGNGARFFEDDQRQVTPLAVAHVMRVFFAHFRRPSPAAKVITADVVAETAAFRAVICEENLLDQS